MKRVFGWLVVLGVAFVLFLLVAFRVVQALERRSNAAERTGAGGPAVVRTVTASAHDLSGRIELTGTLRPLNTVDVLPEVAGRVRQVPVHVGDRVEEGDVLARLDPTDLKLAVDQAEGALAAAIAGEDRARREAETAEKLAVTKAVTENQLVAARAGLAAATGQRQQAKAARDLAVGHLADAAVKTPIHGVLTRASVDVGQMVGPATVAFQVQDDAAYEVEVGLDEASAYAVPVGQPAVVTLLARPDLTLPGHVRTVSPSLDGQTRKADAVVRLDPTPERLLTGSTVKVVLELPPRSGVVLVPEGAIVERSGGKFVRVVGDGNAVRNVAVGTGVHQDGQIEVVGLDPGAVVIVSGPAELADGAVVQPGAGS